MTVTKCDFCGRAINKVEPGITHMGNIRANENSGRLDLIRYGGDDKHYDLCVDCSAKLVNMFERKKSEIKELEE